MTREPDASQWQQIRALIVAGRQEEAVHFYREVSGSGLFEAKDKIAELAQQFAGESSTPVTNTRQPSSHQPPFAPTQSFGQQVDAGQPSMSDDIMAVINKHRGRGTLSLKEALVLIVNLCKGLPASTGGHLRAVAPPVEFDEVDRDILAGETKLAAYKYARLHQIDPMEAEAVIADREDMLRKHAPKLFHAPGISPSGKVIHIKSKWASWAVLIVVLVAMLLFVAAPLVVVFVLMQIGKNMPM